MHTLHNSFLNKEKMSCNKKKSVQIHNIKLIRSKYEKNK